MDGFSTVIVLTVTGVAVIYFIQVHPPCFHAVCPTVHTVFNAATVLQEKHGLHILGLLVNGGKIVRKQII
ncbi:Loki-CTERM sorting domain-containing protein [Bacteroides acidifaciens]|uniref:Loki-CTERM sorting domain-containing protein n=1 Tax=Bacteroides acidifaciens TaxID=85831 RepID=UPI003313D6B4